MAKMMESEVDSKISVQPKDLTEFYDEAEVEKKLPPGRYRVTAEFVGEAVPKPKNKERDAHVPLATDSPVIAQWRQRMGTPEAKEICDECPVREPCLEFALTVREKHGVWGGRTERERRRLIRQRRKSA